MTNKMPSSVISSLDKRKNSNSLRQLKVITELVDFSSNDYLGFSQSIKIYQEAHNTLISRNEKFNGSTGSRLLSGNSALYNEVEDQIAEFHDCESALIFNSGYSANLGIFSSIPQRHDCILYDEYIHASIREGIQLSKASSYKFKHNDFDHLKELLDKLGEKSQNIFVVTESVFSMDGDIPDLNTLIDICRADNIFLIIDEAHATGVFGRYGEGIIQALNIEKHIFARIHTFGKGLGCHGAAVLGGNDLKHFLINFSRSFIYTTALSPHSLATIQSSYHNLLTTDKIEQLKTRISFFKNQIKAHDLSPIFIESSSSIQCCIIPSNTKVKSVSEHLLKAGYDVRPILSPTVPIGKERLRFCIHSFNTEEQISDVLNILAQTLNNV